MIHTIIYWINRYILKRIKVMGLDISTSSDYSCKAEGYKTKDGRIFITKMTYWKK